MGNFYTFALLELFLHCYTLGKKHFARYPWTILPGPIFFYTSTASAASDKYHVCKYCKWSAFLSFFTQPADIVVLNEMKVPSWYFGFLQETIRDVISIAWWLWTAESLVIISDDLDALEIWSSTSTPMRPQQRFHDHKYKITKNTQKQIHQYIWSKTHKYLIIHLYTNEAIAKRIRSFYSTAVFHKLQQYA